MHWDQCELQCKDGLCGWQWPWGTSSLWSRRVERRLWGSEERREWDQWILHARG